MQTRSDKLRHSLFAIVSAYFEPYLYMLKVHCVITAIFHMGEHQTLDHKVAGSILTWGAMLCPEEGTYPSGLVLVNPRKLS